MLAMPRASLTQGPAAFFWMFGPSTQANERRGDVAIVRIRGPMDHHDDSWGENYESIVKRIGDALSGADVVAAHKAKQQRHEWANGYKDDFVPLPDVEADPPAAVILELDTPGGVVSGLNETVAKLQAMSNAACVPLVAYVNEMAASAGYAIACACERIYAPRSAIIGSIGVISTMISVDAKNKSDGIDVRLITSGDRKADGHPHQAITDKAVEAERGRVMKLATDFWRLAGKARGLPMAKLESLQAGIYLGKDAKRVGLIDEIMSLDEAIGDVAGRAPKRATSTETTERPKNPLDTARLSTPRFGSTVAHVAPPPRSPCR